SLSSGACRVIDKLDGGRLSAGSTTTRREKGGAQHRSWLPTASQPRGSHPLRMWPGRASARTHPWASLRRARSDTTATEGGSMTRIAVVTAFVGLFAAAAFAGPKDQGKNAMIGPQDIGGNATVNNATTAISI